MRIKFLYLLFAAFLFAAFTSVAAEQYASPESQGVSSKAILAWVDACEKDLDVMHGFVIRRHGKIIAEGSWKPFDTLNEPHILYSHSKSFVSTAIGFLVDEGKIDLDERVCTIFPDDLPENPDARLLSLRVRDLLTMNFGAKDHILRDGGNWVKTALAKKIHFDPGTKFKYDSDATYLLSAIVSKKSGKDTMEYLDEKLFKPLSFGNVWSTYSPQRIACGGWGMQMNTRDISKLGQLYLNEGEWDSRRILSRDWVRLATSKQTECGWNTFSKPECDWSQGYGFQFWRCRYNSYRADGAGGQYTVVIPDKDAVVSIHAALGDMKKELEYIWKYLLPAMKDAPLAEDAAAAEKLSVRCKSLALKTPEGTSCGVEKFFGKYLLEKNTHGFKSIEFSSGKEGVVCTIEARAGKWDFPVGSGEWKRGVVMIAPESYEGLGAVIGKQTVASSFAVGKDGSLRLISHYINGTYKIDATLTADAAQAVIKGNFYGMKTAVLSGKRINK